MPKDNIQEKISVDNRDNIPTQITELIEEYKAIKAETTILKKAYNRTKLRNNLILGSIVVGCIALNIALVLVPPVGIAGVIMIGASAGLGGISTLGNYLHNKWASEKKTELKKQCNKENITEKLLQDNGFNIDKQKGLIVVTHQKLGIIEEVKLPTNDKFDKIYHIIKFIKPILKNINLIFRKEVNTSNMHNGITSAAKAVNFVQDEAEKLSSKVSNVGPSTQLETNSIKTSNLKRNSFATKISPENIRDSISDGINVIETIPRDLNKSHEAPKNSWVKAYPSASRKKTIEDKPTKGWVKKTKDKLISGLNINLKGK
jgi:hypothetical protein